MTMRSFEDKAATRERVPLLVGLIGPSGGGKTYSALRLATGIQKVSGGDIFVIDTEARRALHYADRFKFRHVEFGAPFGPLDYLAAIEYCQKKGAGVIIVDSMSHEHEGPGGVLEMHEAIVQKMSGGDWKKAAAVNMLAWAKPKAARRAMINGILQMNTNFIFCFRAKEKLRIEKGKEPEKLGFMPIAGEEFIYEMTANCLLMPCANGVPTWESDMKGESMMMKKPEQFRKVLDARTALSEEIGTAMAQWAAGDGKNPTVEEFAVFEKEVRSAKSPDELKAAAARGNGRNWTHEQRTSIRQAIAETKESIAAEAALSAQPPQSDSFEAVASAE